MKGLLVPVLLLATASLCAAVPYTIEYPDGPPAAARSAAPAAVPIIPDRPATLGEYLDAQRAVDAAKPADEQARMQGTSADREALLERLYNTYMIDVPEGETPPDGAERFGDTTAAANYIPPDPLWNSFGNSQSFLSAAWGLTLGSGVTLGLFDLGTYNAHPDLTNFACGNAHGCAFITHGTQTASILGSLINNFGMVGAAPSAAMVAYGETPATEPSDLVLAYSNLIGQTRPRALSVSLLNMGATADVVLQSLYTQGVLPVVAAGNNNGGTVTGLPATLWYPLVVGGSTPQDDWWPGASTGAQVDVIAVAKDVYTAVPPSDFALQQNGTSFAAPLAAGIAGLVDSRDFNLGPYATAQIIKHSARLAVGQTGVDPYRGYGIVDAVDAIQSKRIPVANDWLYNTQNGVATNNVTQLTVDATHEAHFDFTLPNMVNPYQDNGGLQRYRGAILRLPIKQGSGSMSVYSWPGPPYCNFHVKHQELDLAPDDGQWVEIDVSGCLTYPTTSFVVYRSGQGPNDMQIWATESGAPADLRLVNCQGCGRCSGATVYQANVSVVDFFATLLLALALHRLWQRIRIRP